MQSQRVHLPFAPMVMLLGWPDRAACIRAWSTFAQSDAVQKEKRLNGVMIIVCGGPVIHVAQAYTSSLSEGKALLDPLPIASFGKPVDAALKPVSYYHDACFASHGPSGDGQLRGYYYQSGVLMASLPEAAVLALAEAGAQSPGQDGGLIVTTLGGEVCRVADDATAYAQRAAKFFVVIFAQMKHTHDPAAYAKRRDAAKAWVHSVKKALRPFQLGAYGQLAGSGTAFASASSASSTTGSVIDEHEAHAYAIPGQTGYGWADATLHKLRSAKARYDGKDLFVNTDHIKPL